jgi:hypothetical protein
MGNRPPARSVPVITSAILFQAQRPVCLPMAATTVHEAARNSTFAMSPEALWQHALAKGVAGPKGPTVGPMANALADTGQPPESAWPFNGDNHEPQSAPTLAGPPPWAQALLISHRMSAAEVAETILGGTPVLVVMDIFQEFRDAGATGMIEQHAAVAKRHGRHAVVCVAYDYLGDNGDELHMLIRNSWGVEWGFDGHAWISATTFDRVQLQTATAAVNKPATGVPLAALGTPAAD